MLLVARDARGLRAADHQTAATKSISQLKHLGAANLCKVDFVPSEQLIPKFKVACCPDLSISDHFSFSSLN